MKEINNFLNIQNQFFYVSDNITAVKLEYTSPNDIFDTSLITKVPVLKDEFLTKISSAFSYVPQKHKINLEVYFDDIGHYTNKQLEDIFKKNIELQFRKNLIRQRQKNNIAISFSVAGILFFLLMLIFNNTLNDGLIKDIIIYVMLLFE